MRILLMLVSAFLLLASPATAQETRVGEKGFESPAASIDSLGWLVGQWTGEGIQGAPAMESWLPPVGGTMVGTFVQTTGSDPEDSAIMFTEHLYIMPDGKGSLVLKLKHFNADLTSWEERDDMVTFRLLALEDCAAYFNGLTLRCDEREDGTDGLVAAVRMQSGGELFFRFARMDPAERQVALCPEATTTTGNLRRCRARLERAEARMTEYLDAALKTVGHDDAQTLLMQSTQEGFLAYRGGECGAVHEKFAGGTIRTTMYLNCATRLTNQRTHTIWRNWLTYMDSTPPILPEPKPTM